MSFYKNQQKSVHFRSRTLFCFFKKKQCREQRKKSYYFFRKNRRKIRQKKWSKKTEKKTRSKKWSKLVQKEKNARLIKPSAILTKKLKALVLLEFGKQKPSLYIYNLLINIIRIWYNL